MDTVLGRGNETILTLAEKSLTQVCLLLGLQSSLRAKAISK